jgi:hypothetical protein
MDHLVFLDTGARELENLVNGQKSMILRGADIIKVPHGSVKQGDILYFINGSREKEVTARGVVTCVFNSVKLSVEESYETIIRNQDKLQLPDGQFESFAGKRYLVLIGVDNIESVKPFTIDQAVFNGSDDWYSVGDISLAVMPRLTAGRTVA